jgi:hypothetical protein
MAEPMIWNSIPTRLHYKNGSALVDIFCEGELLETCSVKEFFRDSGPGENQPRLFEADESTAYQVASDLARTGSSRLNNLLIKLSE